MMREGDILHWAAKRNILQGASPGQIVWSAMEKMDGLFGALAVMEAADQDDLPSTEDIARAIGDTTVTLTILAHIFGLTIDACVQCAGLFNQEAERQQDGHEGDILRWAAERNILQCSSPCEQVTKTLGGLEELVDALAAVEAGDEDEPPSVEDVADAIGDTIVTLTIIARVFGLTIDKCVQCAGLFSKETERQQNET